MSKELRDMLESEEVDVELLIRLAKKELGEEKFNELARNAIGNQELPKFDSAEVLNRARETLFVLLVASYLPDLD